ncbi:glycoside hydrolase family 5 protein [Panacibacter sp. DH6]|uniref:Glycoside hydrolase family 5 protein n=1 Tax=Panacibacter microcysteis TaxID=2793269 RepID=A0A931GYV7_9BACT|nr:glycoside hydrolase family 5 protein [Panacibacter microcysteis]MBG9377883.1 glycoside hydrolase family 5 protein [Panacibacter microcysteis]
MNPLKKIVLLFLSAITGSLALQAQAVQEHGRLMVKGTQLTDKNNQPVILRGMSFGWSNFHPRFYTPGAVEWLHKDWHCNVVRAAMGVEPKNGYMEDPAKSLALVETVIDAAIKEDIYVIVDFHSHNVRLQEAKTFFTHIAKKYSQYPNVIYEVFNEPDKETWPEVKDYSIEMIQTIRTFDTANIILVGSPHWDQDVHLAAADPVTGFTNIMYTMHFYADTHKQQLRDRTTAAINAGLPVFISESAGMSASGDGPINIDEWTRWINWAEENKVSWVTWSVSDKNETCSVLQAGAASDGNWKEDDLKESGKLVKKMITAYQ